MPSTALPATVLNAPAYRLPSRRLTDVGKRLQPAQVKDKIRKGGGLMPPFAQLSQQEIDDLASYLAK